MRRSRLKRDNRIGAALRSMPMRDPAPGFFDRLMTEFERERSGSAASLMEGTGRGRRVAVLALTAVLGATVGTLTTATVYAANQGGGASSSPVTTFEPANGWNLVLTTVDPNNPNLPIVWAANVPFAPEEPSSGFPDNTAAVLPPNGILMTVIGPREYTGGEIFPPANLPLTIGQGFCSHDQYETQPAPHVSKCLVNTMVGGQLLNVVVWFGTNTPSTSIYEEADAQLARLLIAGQE